MGDHYGRHEIEAQDDRDPVRAKALAPNWNSPVTASRRITDKTPKNDYYVGSKNSTNPAERMSYDDLMDFLETNNPDNYVFFELVPKKIEKKITIS